MSALDLFASALGAFILIAVVLFPYFPNTGDSPERVAEVRAALEAKLAEVRATLEAKLAEVRATLEAKLAREREAHEATKRALSQCESEKNACDSELKSVKFPHLDIVIALDITGSMRDQITGLRNEVDELAYVLLKLAPSVGMGVVAFGDRCYDTPTSTFNLREIRNNTDIETIKNFTTTIEPGMGQGRPPCNSDRPEAINLALNEAANMRWRSQAEKKVIIIVTDNPVYPEEETNTLAVARRFAGRDATNSVSTIFAETGGSESNTQTFLSALAEAGRGQYVEGAVSMTASILRSLL